MTMMMTDHVDRAEPLLAEVSYWRMRTWRRGNDDAEREEHPNRELDPGILKICLR